MSHKQNAILLKLKQKTDVPDKSTLYIYMFSIEENLEQILHYNVNPQSMFH